MNDAVQDQLIQKMRGDLANALGAAEALTSLVRERGSGTDRLHLAMLSQSLYQQLRTILHLELTRSGDPAFRPCTADLAALCLDVSRQVEGLAKVMEVQLRYESEPGSFLTALDPSLVELATLSLLANALSHAGKGGRVSFKLLHRKDKAVLTVTDNGPGLEGGPVPAAEGAGLGLQMARRVAQLHGGALVLEDREDGGVRAALSLPLVPGEGLYLESPKMGFLLTGGYSPALIELSDLLPTESYDWADLE